MDTNAVNEGLARLLQITGRAEDGAERAIEQFSRIKQSSQEEVLREMRGHLVSLDITGLDEDRLASAALVLDQVMDITAKCANEAMVDEMVQGMETDQAIWLIANVVQGVLATALVALGEQASVKVEEVNEEEITTWIEEILSEGEGQ